MRSRAFEKESHIVLSNAHGEHEVSPRTGHVGDVPVLPFVDCGYLLHDPETEDESAAVLLAGHTPLVFVQACVALPSDSSQLLLELRFFNRTLGTVRFASPLSFDEVVLSPRDTVAFEGAVGGALFDYTSLLSSRVEPSLSAENPASLPLGLRGGAHLRAAHEATRASDFRAALDSLDCALTTLGDDPLTWWHRAVLLRHLGEDNETELTTAHALSPLEPVLRAEAFLAVPQTMGKEPTTVLRPLVERPHDLYEAVHLLTVSGFVQDAARVIDEALRHRDFPLLRYVYAWNLYTSTRMQVEAADQVRRASATGEAPALPVRSTEVAAVHGLAGAFPKDERLAELVKRSGPAV